MLVGIHPAVPEPEEKTIELQCAFDTFVFYFRSIRVNEGRVSACSDGKEYTATCKGSITKSIKQKQKENSFFFSLFKDKQQSFLYS